MSKIARMMQQATAGAGGAGLDVDEVFSTFLYEGNSSTQTITNSIDLSGEGGLVWIKARDSGQEHNLYDTERGVYKFLQSQSNAAEDQNVPKGLTAFNSNGFSLDVGNESGSSFNNSSYNYVSWTFRKAPKFFDVVTYTGTSSPGTTVNHNLGSVPGMIMVKCLSHGSSNWRVYHRGNHASDPEDYALRLNATSAQGYSDSYWNNSAPTSTQFTLGGDDDVNDFGDSYVAYLFAHNNNDGEFGPDSDQDIIKCGSYTGNQSTQDINLGFEPQWIMIKPSTTTGAWYMWDNMRGVVTGDDDWYLRANDNSDENDANNIKFNSTGFSLENATVNANTQDYIYVAIRRGPLAVPEDATKVFAIDNPQSQQIDPGLISGFPVDFALGKIKNSSGTNWYAASRLTGNKYLETNNTTAQQATSSIAFDYNNGWWDGVNNANFVGWMWRRAPGYFDVVLTTQGATNIPHSLGVVPEMIWSKKRNGTSDWIVTMPTISGNQYGYLNKTDAFLGGTAYGTFSSTVFTTPVIGTYNAVNYLFASVNGVSKVGSYTGNGSSNGDSQNIDCGFSSGARFVMIKDTSASSNWFVVDTTRGLVSGADKHIALNLISAEETDDVIDPYSLGFTVNRFAGEFNQSGRTYIFYAIA